MYKKLLYMNMMMGISYMYGMSHTIALVPMMNALHETEKKILGHHNWKMINKEQELVVQKYMTDISYIEKLRHGECKCYVSNDMRYINQVLYENNFKLQLERLAANDFSVVSMANFLCIWKKKGEKTIVMHNDKRYTAVKIEYEWRENGYAIMKADLDYIVQLITSTGDTVSLAIADKERTGLDLLDKIIQMNKSKQHDVTSEYASVVFPMVNLSYQPDMSWFVGMGGLSKEKTYMTLKHALQQVNVQMSARGMSPQNYVTVSMKKSFIINYPFYVWINRLGIDLPLVAAYIHPNDWKEPNRD